jgi:hypothetical protein
MQGYILTTQIQIVAPVENGQNKIKYPIQYSK